MIPINRVTVIVAVAVAVAFDHVAGRDSKPKQEPLYRVKHRPQEYFDQEAHVRARIEDDIPLPPGHPSENVRAPADFIKDEIGTHFEKTWLEKDWEAEVHPAMERLLDALHATGLTPLPRRGSSWVPKDWFSTNRDLWVPSNTDYYLETYIERDRRLKAFPEVQREARILRELIDKYSRLQPYTVMHQYAEVGDDGKTTYYPARED